MKNAILLSFFNLIFYSNLYSKDYIIYAVSLPLPMGEPNEVLTKNYYVNIGPEQGIKTGAILDVYRTISMSDPYETKNKYNHKIKIGELKVLHSEGGSAIAKIQNLNQNEETPVTDLKSFIIGDRVYPKLK